MMEPRFLRAGELGVRLEIVSGSAIWEAQPLYKHQKAVERIAQSIRHEGGSCQCVHAYAVASPDFPEAITEGRYRRASAFQRC